MNQALLLGPNHSNQTLASLSPIRPKAPRKGSSYQSSLQVGHSELHTSASEVFSQVSLPPPLTRHTTYSSLPPSPRHESRLDFGISKTQGLGIRDLEDMLVKLTSSNTETPRFDRKDFDNAGEDDEFWPASSRRQSVIEIHPEGAQSPPSDVDHGRGVSKTDQNSHKDVSFWDLLKDEVGAEDWDGYFVDGKWYVQAKRFSRKVLTVCRERIANFLAVPLAVEKVCGILHRS